MGEEDRHGPYSYEATWFGGKVDTNWELRGSVNTVIREPGNIQQEHLALVKFFFFFG